MLINLWSFMGGMFVRRKGQIARIAKLITFVLKIFKVKNMYDDRVKIYIKSGNG